MPRLPRRLFVALSALLILVAVAIDVWLESRPAQFIPTTGWYSVYFTTPAQSSGEARAQRDGLDERLVELLSEAQQSIDVAIYGFDLENVARTLAAAHDRGVRVRMVTDSDTIDSTDEPTRRAVAIVKQAGIPIVADERSPIMHHKFVVVDREWIWTGSWNFTHGDTYRLNNNTTRFRVPALADNFTVEFEKMFVQRKFGPTKPTDLPHPILDVDGAQVQTCFESEMECDELVTDVVRSAQQSVHFLAFAFTHDGIGDAMVDRHQAGVEVTGVFETTGSNTSFSEYGKMKEAGVSVFQDGNRYSMHHKVIVVDHQTVVFGSFNFSAGASNDNDENLLIVTNPDFAQEFETEFARVLDVAQRGR